MRKCSSESTNLDIENIKFYQLETASFPVAAREQEKEDNLSHVPLRKALSQWGGGQCQLH